MILWPVQAQTDRADETNTLEESAPAGAAEGAIPANTAAAEKGGDKEPGTTNEEAKEQQESVEPEAPKAVPPKKPMSKSIAAFFGMSRWLR